MSSNTGYKLWKSRKIKMACFLLFIALCVYLTAVVQLRFSTLGVEKMCSSSAPPATTLVACERPTSDYDCLCYVDDDGERCALTIKLTSRLGNNMGEYAALYSFGSLNRRPAFITRQMAAVLKRYFKITLPVLSVMLEECIAWKDTYIHDYMEDSYAHFEGRFLRIIGTPYSWRFYHQVADEIRREFTFHDEIQDRAQRKLGRLRGNRTSVTFVGVHVRRGDYVDELRKRLRGVLANENYVREATGRFRKRYPDAIFVVVSDDREWCVTHIGNNSGDVFFAGNNNQSDPIEDMALLASCNHTIMTIGSFGYWAGFLAGGDVIYLANYTLPDSELNPFLRFETVFWPHWEPIAANLSEFGH